MAAAPVEIAAWRATFSQPKPKPGQLAIRITALVPVEVYRRTRHTWDAREPHSGNGYGLEGVDSAESAKAHIASLFRECVEPWKPYDRLGNLIEETVHAE